MLTCMHITDRYPGLSTHTFIHYLKGEKLSLSSRVTPGTDIGLVGDSGSDSPPRDINRIYICNNESALTKYSILYQQN